MFACLFQPIGHKTVMLDSKLVSLELLSGFQVVGGNTQALASVCIDCSVDSRLCMEIRRLLLVFALTARWIPGCGWKYAGSC